jgi:hypothetical protein
MEVTNRRKAPNLQNFNASILNTYSGFVEAVSVFETFVTRIRLGP